VGERHGFVPMLASIAREKGVSAYIGDGQNLWPSVHRLDAARVYLLAIEQGAQGGPFHAVADEGVPFRQIAEAIGKQLGVPTTAIPPEEAAGHFGLLAGWIAGNGPATSVRTRARLGWMPEQLGLIRDISRPEYFN
jgi:nucleoside-diphosphate-sugar epimerase